MRILQTVLRFAVDTTPYHQASLAGGQVVDLHHQTPSGGGYSLTFVAHGVLR